MADERKRALIRSASAMAARAHRGQVDKSGQPYIEHPRRVAQNVRLAYGDYREVIVAWLHDVAEDGPKGRVEHLEEIRKEFGPAVAQAVDAITRRKGETNDEYYSRVAKNTWALTVKAADIKDNTDPARLAALDEPTRERLIAKYEHAKAVLWPTPVEETA
jgi:(p)ppGpp synthase/HD superfamily hydrolase